MPTKRTKKSDKKHQAKAVRRDDYVPAPEKPSLGGMCVLVDEEEGQDSLFVILQRAWIMHKCPDEELGNLLARDWDQIYGNHSELEVGEDSELIMSLSRLISASTGDWDRLVRTQKFVNDESCQWGDIFIAAVGNETIPGAVPTDWTVRVR